MFSFNVGGSLPLFDRGFEPNCDLWFPTGEGGNFIRLPVGREV